MSCENIMPMPIENPLRTKELRSQPRGVAVLDLDGVITGYTRYIDKGVENGFSPDGDAVSEFVATISSLRSRGVLPLVLTNRPPGQMQLYPTILGVQEGTWATENGGSFYDVGEHKNFVNPRFGEYATTVVPAIKTRLHEALGIGVVPLDSEGPQYEPGGGYVKVVLRPPSGQEAKKWAESIQIHSLLSPFAGVSRIEVGKSIDIDPIGLSKGIGMEDLLKLNGIDPNKTPTAFIADASRDIVGAQALLDLGERVFIGAVGNAKPDYQQFVEQIGGVVAPKDTSYHRSASYLLNQFANTFGL